MYVYTTSNIQHPYAVWGEMEKQQIYHLLHITESSSVVILARTGVYIFDCNLGTQDYTTVLAPRQCILNDHAPCLQGVVIPAAHAKKFTEVWLYSTSPTEYGFTILDPCSFSVVKTVLMDPSPLFTRNVRNLQLIVTNDCCYLAIAFHHKIERWSVKDRLKIDEFDMIDYCKKYFGDNGKRCSVDILLHVSQNGDKQNVCMHVLNSAARMRFHCEPLATSRGLGTY